MEIGMKTLEERAKIISDVIIKESALSTAKHYVEKMKVSGMKPTKAELEIAIKTNWEKIVNEIFDTSIGVVDVLFKDEGV
jgi:hypothetical protein